MELASDDGMTLTRPNADQDELIRAADEKSDEEFWMNLPASDSRTGHIQGIPTRANRNYPGMIVKSSADALRAAKLHGKNVVDTSR